VIRGAAAVVGQVLTFVRPDAAIHPAVVNGAAGAVVTAADRPVSVIGFTTRAGGIVAIDGVAAPARTNPFGDTTLTLCFNGRTWSRIPSPNALSGNSTDQNWLTSVSAVAANDVWAVSRAGNHDAGLLDQTLIEHWDGARWTIVPSPDPGGASQDNDLWGVAAVTTGDIWRWAVLALS
jgi:hypothetical protein